MMKLELTKKEIIELYRHSKLEAIEIAIYEQYPDLVSDITSSIIFDDIQRIFMLLASSVIHSVVEHEEISSEYKKCFRMVLIALIDFVYQSYYPTLIEIEDLTTFTFCSRVYTFKNKEDFGKFTSEVKTIIEIYGKL